MDPSPALGAARSGTLSRKGRGWKTSARLPPSYSAALTNATKRENFDRALWAFSISNAVPFVGALTLERDVKLTLLCGDAPISAEKAQQPNAAACAPIPHPGFQLLVLLQAIFSALCVFFIALALRNYFKLR